MGLGARAGQVCYSDPRVVALILDFFAAVPFPLTSYNLRLEAAFNFSRKAPAPDISHLCQLNRTNRAPLLT